MLSTQNVSVQFGAKPLFEQVTVKFADGNRYGLIGANGCGKSTLMKVLGGELEPSTGEVVLQLPRDQVLRLRDAISYVAGQAPIVGSDMVNSP